MKHPWSYVGKILRPDEPFARIGPLSGLAGGERQLIGLRLEDHGAVRIS
jgi:hypothetical protein